MALATLACGEAPAPQAGEPVHERRPTVVAWDTLWVRGGEADTLLLMPLDVVANDEHVYVLDGGGKRVVALRAADGELAWVTGRAGAGPGEFAAPTALTLTRAGSLLVADHQNARITVLDPSGTVTGNIPFNGYSYVQGICGLADGDVIVATLEGERPIIHLSPQGAVKQRVELPWPELREAEPLARQAFLASADDFRSCTLALPLGRGFAVYRDGGFQTVADYVEPISLPELETSERSSPSASTRSTRMRKPDFAASDVAVANGIVAVGFRGKTPAAGRLIDHYDLRTGRYAESYEFPHPLSSLARAGNRYLILHQVDGYPTLAAVVPSSTP
jgi:outer membrane protein assembly factor BamB